MAEHLSDEEQIESLKRWLRENGMRIVVTVLIVVGGWFGWQQWQGYQERQAAKASLLFNEMMTLAEVTSLAELPEDDQQRIQDLANSLTEQYRGSQYARFANMLQARLAVEKDDYEAAAAALQSVVDDGGDRELQAVARLRLARLHLAQDQLAKALSLLQGEVPEGMAAQFAELRGDVHFAAGEHEAALAAYQTANDLVAAGSNRMLELKLNRVLPPEVNPVAAGSSVSGGDPAQDQTVETPEQESAK